MSRILGALILSASVVSPAAAVEVGNSELGHAYAQRVCAECHAVEKDIGSAFPEVPSFQEVADTEGMSPRALLVWLQTPHPNMPDFIIPNPISGEPCTALTNKTAFNVPDSAYLGTRGSKLGLHGAQAVHCPVLPPQRF